MEGITGRRRASRRVRGIIALEIAVGAVLRLAVVTRPIAQLDNLYVPDDTYYTLTIARFLSQGHGPTTDGHTLTSGFQPLIAFLMVPVYWLTQNADLALRADLALLLVCDLAIAALLAYVALRLAGPIAAVIAAGIWVLSPAAIRIAAGGLETTLAMACEVALVAAWMWAGDRPTLRRNLLVGALAGFAVLARIDAILLVGILAAITLWRGPRKQVLQVGIAAAAVVAPWWLYCIVEFGSPIPASGTAARSLQPGRPLRPFMLSLTGTNVLIGPFGAWTRWEVTSAHRASTWPFWVVVVGFAVVAAAGLRRSRHPAESLATTGPATGMRAGRGSGDWAVAASLPLFGIALVVFYAWYNVSYYTFRYVAPACMVVTLLVACAAARALHRARSRPSRAPVVGVWAVLLIITVALARPIFRGDHVALRGDFDPIRDRLRIDASTGFRQQAIEMNRWVPGGATLAGEQTGALSYFAVGRRHVVNLDGVVNPDAYRARQRNDTQGYIRSRDIHWFADNQLFLTLLILELNSKPGATLNTRPGAVVVRFRHTLAAPEGSQPIFVVRLEYPDH